MRDVMHDPVDIHQFNRPAVFEVAGLVGLDLLADAADIDSAWARARDTIALLPARVRRRGAPDDDF